MQSFTADELIVIENRLRAHWSIPINAILEKYNDVDKSSRELGTRCTPAAIHLTIMAGLATIYGEALEQYEGSTIAAERIDLELFLRDAIKRGRNIVRERKQRRNAYLN